MDLSCFATLLYLYSVIIPALSLECTQKQYKWPSSNPQFCCNKCKPGEYMEYRNPKNCDIRCKRCTGERYTESYNVEKCEICRDCSKDHMETDTQCTRTHNAVCRCEKGYACVDPGCSYCIESPTTTTTTRTPSTTVSIPTRRTFITTTTSTTTTSTSTSKPVHGKVTDTAWFLIIISLLCLGLALVIVTQMKPLLSWFRRHKDHWLVEKPTATLVSMPTEEEEEEEDEEDEPSTPVQEMCGKCDQPIDV